MREPLVKKGDLPESIEQLTHRILGCALEVHTQLGPGLLEKIYEDALVYELRQAGLRVVQQAEIEIPYKQIILRGQRIDVHLAQLLGYLRAIRQPLGLLLNFNAYRLKDGIHRIFNERALPRPSNDPLLPNPPSSRPSRPLNSSR